MSLKDIEEGMVLYGGAPNLAVNDVLLKLASPGRARARARPNAKHPLVVLDTFPTHVKVAYVASFGGATALANVPRLKPEHRKYFIAVQSSCSEESEKQEVTLRLERGSHPKRSWVCVLSSAIASPLRMAGTEGACDDVVSMELLVQYR